MPPQCLAIDTLTNLPIADYTWLPKALQPTYHAILELDEGVALIHFAGCIDVLSPSNVATTNHVTTRMKVLLLSTDALYFCSGDGDILRCVLLTDVEDIVTCDEWTCCCCPATFDIAFRLDTSHLGEASPLKGSRASERDLLIPRHQGHFIAIFNGLRQARDLAALLPVVVQSHYSIASRNLARPRGLPAAPPPPPIPFLSFDEIRTTVENPNTLIDCFTFQHRLRCPRVEAWELKRRRKGSCAPRSTSDVESDEDDEDECRKGNSTPQASGGTKEFHPQAASSPANIASGAIDRTATLTVNVPPHDTSRLTRLAAILDDEPAAPLVGSLSAVEHGDTVNDQRNRSVDVSNDDSRQLAARTAPSTPSQHPTQRSDVQIGKDRRANLSYMHPTASSRVKSEQMAVDRTTADAERQIEGDSEQKVKTYKATIKPAQRPKKDAPRQPSPLRRIQLSPRAVRTHDCRAPTAASVAKQSEKRAPSSSSPLLRRAVSSIEKSSSSHSPARVATPRQLKDQRLSLVWEELVAQRRSLEYLTRHVEGMLFPQTTASPTRSVRQPSHPASPQRAVSSKMPASDNGRGPTNIPRHIDVASLSEYQRSLLLRPTEGPYYDDGKRGPPSAVAKGSSPSRVVVNSSSPPRAVQIHNKVDAFVHQFTSTAPSLRIPSTQSLAVAGSSPHHLKMTKSTLRQNVLLNKQSPWSR